ncbi:MAG: AEC family transporter [Candidatus Omnitrophica bacterium]|nr:AEC family transporter [Candidatus Omnitrophota bacterium]
MFAFVLYRIGIIFAILFIGALARRVNILTKETTDGLCRLAIEVTLPFLYFYTLSANLNRGLFLSIWSMPLWAVGLTFVSLVLGWAFSSGLKSDLRQRRTFLFLVTFGNYGFLAIPLVYALFGQEGLVIVSVFNLGVAFLYWTLGLVILTGVKGKGLSVFKNLFNTATFALVSGLIVGISPLTPPKFILEVSQLIGNASIPLALIVVGSILAHRDAPRNFSFRTIFSLVFCRNVLTPAIVLLSVNVFFALPKMILAIIVLQAAMPAASTTPILTAKFNGDTDFAASAVFFSTLFGIITIPLFISLAF